MAWCTCTVCIAGPGHSTPVGPVTAMISHCDQVLSEKFTFQLTESLTVTDASSIRPAWLQPGNLHNQSPKVFGEKLVTLSVYSGKRIDLHPGPRDATSTHVSTGLKLYITGGESLGAGIEKVELEKGAELSLENLLSHSFNNATMITIILLVNPSLKALASTFL